MTTEADTTEEETKMEIVKDDEKGDGSIKKKEATFHARPSGRVAASITTDNVRISYFEEYMQEVSNEESNFSFFFKFDFDCI